MYVPKVLIHMSVGVINQRLVLSDLGEEMTH